MEPIVRALGLLGQRAYEAYMKHTSGDVVKDVKTVGKTVSELFTAAKKEILGSPTKSVHQTLNEEIIIERENKLATQVNTVQKVDIGINTSSVIASNQMVNENNNFSAAPREIQKDYNFCPDCGVKLVKSSNFCHKCGSKLKD